MPLQISGQLLILWAFGANIAAGIGFAMAARGRTQYLSLARTSYHALTLFTALASVLLYYLIFAQRFEFEYVYGYTDSALPFFYLLSAFWGGQEGTYLLWLLLSALFGYFIWQRGGRYTNWAMAVYCVVNFFFTVMLIKVSPFALMPFWPPDGAGLNPLLQDPWMVIHPPVMFIGYAMAGLPFALGIAALIKKDYTDWVKRVFPFVALTALFLAAGNILGGYWAYKTLGWGGYWAWDPVENSSLIPWFMSLALLHGLILERRSGALRKTNIILAAVTFWLVVYGTFLTRSGVLADFSVHSFVDLGQNSFLIGFLALFAGMTLAVFIPRVKTTGNAPINYNFWGREFILLSAMLLLMIFSIIVLFWSSLPILTKLVGATPRAADIATYNDFALPMGIIYALLLTLSPLVNFKPSEPANWKKVLPVVVVGALVAGVVITFVTAADLVFAVLFTIVLTGLVMGVLNRELRTGMIPGLVLFVLALVISYAVGVEDYLYLLLIAGAAAAIGSNLSRFIQLVPGQWRVAGAHLTHFGFGLMLIGILASSAYDSSERLVLEQNAPKSAYGMQVTFEGMANSIETPKNELILKVKENGSVAEGRPQLYFSQRMDGLMKRPYIKRHLLSDFYFSPQDIRIQEAQEGLALKKGEAVPAGGYRFIFQGFEMGQHGDGQDMKVTAKVIVEHGDHADTLRPTQTFIMGEQGSTTMDSPAEFGHGDNKYMMSITKILADQGAVVVDIPGLVGMQGGERLLMDVSRKPLINLVWVGTTFILIGGIIVYIRRRRESAAA